MANKEMAFTATDLLTMNDLKVYAIILTRSGDISMNNANHD